MKSILTSAFAASTLALAACGGQGDDALGDNVAEAHEQKAEQLEEAADNASGAQADMLEEQAEQVEEAGYAKEEAIDEADVTVNQE